MPEQPLTPIADSLWWVIPEQLAGVRKPAEDDLSDLVNQGIRAIVSLLSDDSNLKLYAQQGIPYIWLPIEGGAAPSLEQLKQLMSFVEFQNQLGNAVAIHCSNGRRRTGTVLAAFLILTGNAYEEAMQTILTANPSVELREAQTSFLQELSTWEGSPYLQT